MVVLPAPFGPRSANTSPSSTVRSIPSRPRGRRRTSSGHGRRSHARPWARESTRAGGGGRRSPPASVPMADALLAHHPAQIRLLAVHQAGKSRRPDSASRSRMPRSANASTSCRSVAMACQYSRRGPPAPSKGAPARMRSAAGQDELSRGAHPGERHGQLRQQGVRLVSRVSPGRVGHVRRALRSPRAGGARSPRAGRRGT